MTVLTKNPHTDSHIELGNSGGHGASNYAYVNDNDDTSYVLSQATGIEYDLYGTGDSTVPAGATINKVTVFAKERYETFGNTSVAGGESLGLGANVATFSHSITTAWAWYNHVWTTNPWSGLPWTQADIVGILGGARLQTGNIGVRIPECSEVYIEIDYTVVSPPSGVTRNTFISQHLLIMMLKPQGLRKGDKQFVKTQNKKAVYAVIFETKTKKKLL